MWLQSHTLLQGLQDAEARCREAYNNFPLLRTGLVLVLAALWGALSTQLGRVLKLQDMEFSILLTSTGPQLVT